MQVLPHLGPRERTLRGRAAMTRVVVVPGCSRVAPHPPTVALVNLAVVPPVGVLRDLNFVLSLGDESLHALQREERDQLVKTRDVQRAAGVRAKDCPEVREAG